MTMTEANGLSPRATPDASYSDKQLLFAATARCRCGAGLAHPLDLRDPHGSWSCSRLLKGEPATGGHDVFPFAFYEIKSEGQPSARGATTRPPGTRLFLIQRAACPCGTSWELPPEPPNALSEAGICPHCKNENGAHRSSDSRTPAISTRSTYRVADSEPEPPAP